MRFSQIYFLQVSEVVELNRKLVAEFGGTHGVLKPSELDSAVHAPRTYEFGVILHPSLAAMAAALTYALARNHAFSDGNKRTAFAAGKIFLTINGQRIRPRRQTWVTLIEEVAVGRVSRQSLTAAFANELGQDIEIVAG